MNRNPQKTRWLEPSPCCTKSRSTGAYNFFEVSNRIGAVDEQGLERLIQLEHTFIYKKPTITNLSLYTFFVLLLLIRCYGIFARLLKRLRYIDQTILHFIWQSHGSVALLLLLRMKRTFSFGLLQFYSFILLT